MPCKKGGKGGGNFSFLQHSVFAASGIMYLLPDLRTQHVKVVYCFREFNVLLWVSARYALNFLNSESDSVLFSLFQIFINTLFNRYGFVLILKKGFP